MSDTPNIGFVRHEPIPPSAPPIQQAGVVKWIRENPVSYTHLTLPTICSV